MKASVVIAIVLLIVGSALIGIAVMPDSPSPQLEFPIATPDSVERLAAYHTPDWGEPGVYHNGIDLIVSTNVSILSPVDGRVSFVTEDVNPYAGNILFSIGIAIDMIWEVKLVLEPGFKDSTNNSLQTDAILVSNNDVVSAGEKVATLLYSENYCHLHYMLLYRATDVSPYDFSSPTAQAIFEEIADRSNSTIQYDYDMPQFTDTLFFRVSLGSGVVLVFIALVLVWRSRRS